MPRAVAWIVCIGAVMFAGAAWADSLLPPPNRFAQARPGPTTVASPSGNAAPSPPAPMHLAGGPRCTIATITEDIGTNDTYLSRMTFPAPESPASANRQPICAAGAAPMAAQRALDACKRRASNPYNCVYGDTDHMFDVTTDVVDSSPLDSLCAGYAAKFIAIACRHDSPQDDCSVACGDTEAAATGAAQSKCHTTHGGDCALLNAAPVPAP